MRRTRALVLSLVLSGILAIAPGAIRAQLENNTWYFGNGEGLDFSTNPPTFLRDGSLYCFEGSASISDPATGKLLFYTDGISVWNRAHRLMPNGNGLHSHWSATQPALMIPDPGDPSKYYIFTADHSGYGGAVRGINYSKVDMTLDGGFGDVTVKNSQLLNWASEKLTAVKICNSSEYWIIAHGYFSSKFYAWKVNKNGVSNPVVSEVGSYHGPALDDGVGWMSASPDGTMLALAHFTRTSDNIELFKFDALSGTVSNGLVIGNAYQPYGITFSPQNKKLYATSVGRIDQYDVTAWNAQTITNSWSPLNSAAQDNGAIKIGPDGKIYVQHSAYLGVIAQPELTGVLCQYTEAVIRTSDGAKYGLPNNVDAAANIACGPPDAHIRSFPGPICEAECVSFRDSSHFGPTTWSWEFEGAVPATSTARDPQNICYAKAGTYKIQLTASNASGSSTDIKYITVQKCDPPDVTLRDTAICATKCVTFVDTNKGEYVRQWLFEGGTPTAYYGDTPPPVCYDSAGVFEITLIATNPWGSDTAISTVTVNECPGPIARSAHDTVVCMQTPVMFTDRSTNDPTSWEWSFEGGTPATSSTQNPGPITYDAAGLYAVRQIASNVNGADTAYTQIRVTRCDPPVATLLDHDICEGGCIELVDASLNTPTSWLWTVSGPTTLRYTSRAPGRICFTTPGTYRLKLLVHNQYGADSATSTILVRSAAGWTSPALDVSNAIELCAARDTFITVYSGCAPLDVTNISSNDPSVVPLNDPFVLKAYDTIRIPVRIAPRAIGPMTATLSLTIGAEQHTVPVSYEGMADAEQFSVAAFDGNFATLACDPLLRTVTISNEACASHAIASITIEPPGTAFTVVLNDPDPLIPAKGQFEFQVQYDADLAASAQAELVIRTGGGEERRIPLSGVRLSPASGVLRITATGPTSLLPNEPTTASLSFDQAVESRLAPEVIEMRFSYNSDVVSASEVTSLDGWSIVSEHEDANGLDLRVSRTRSSIAANAEVVRIEFKSFLAAESTTELLLDRVICDPDDADFERCVFDLEAVDTAGVAILTVCGTNELRSTLGGDHAIELIVSPHPVVSTKDLQFTLSTRLPSLLGQQIGASLIDLAGRRTTILSSSLVSSEQEMRIPLKGVAAGTYVLEVRVGALSKTTLLVIQ